MAKLYFRYGEGKSAQCCQVAYNYVNERGMDILVINAKDNDMITSKVMVDGKELLYREPNMYVFDDSFYCQIYDRWLNNDLKCVLIDNCEYLNVTQVEDLFKVSKILDVPVIAYGNRMINNRYRSDGACRLMALADNIEKIEHGMVSKKATLNFNYGAMNCSKTSDLLVRDRTLTNSGCKTCIVKPKLDRDIFCISSRIGLSKKADIVLDKDDGIYGQAEYLYRERVNYILVDEVQFLTPSQIEQIRRIVDDYDIPVTCYGLKTDFLSNLFPGSQRLLELADNINKMKTVCSCGRGADFNVRKDRNGNYVTQGEQIVIDDGGNYDSECALCFMEHVMKIDMNVKKRVLK